MIFFSKPYPLDYVEIRTTLMVHCDLLKIARFVELVGFLALVPYDNV